MCSYKPPYTITSKILSLSTAITEEITKIEVKKKSVITPKLRKKNRIRFVPTFHVGTDTLKQTKFIKSFYHTTKQLYSCIVLR